MSEEKTPEPLSKVTLICWMLVGVTIVCIFAAKVSMHAEDMKWSRVVPPPAPRVQRGPTGR